jgi:hypothetical protein
VSHHTFFATALSFLVTPLDNTAVDPTGIKIRKLTNFMVQSLSWEVTQVVKTFPKYSPQDEG